MDDTIVTAYMSHCIRGRKGNGATLTEIQTNCTKAIIDGMKLAYLVQHAGVKLELYIPAAHDEFVHKAYSAGRITEDEILTTDCDILRERNLLLVYDWDNYISRGMQVEVNHAKEYAIPTYVFSEITPRTVCNVVSMCLDVLEERAKQPKIIQLKGVISEGTNL